jgi:hypothetical protein
MAPFAGLLESAFVLILVAALAVFEWDVPILRRLAFVALLALHLLVFALQLEAGQIMSEGVEIGF